MTKSPAELITDSAGKTSCERSRQVVNTSKRDLAVERKVESSILGIDKFCHNSLMPSIRSGALRAGKRYDAVESFIKKVDWFVLGELPATTIWAPELRIAGLVTSPATLCAGTVVVYLSPFLEFESQAYVNHTVAHEFAHIFLGHHLSGNKEVAKAKAELDHELQPHEIAADNLAAEWGFKKPRRQTWLISTIFAFARGLKTQRALDRFRTMLGLHVVNTRTAVPACETALGELAVPPAEPCEE